MPLDIDSFEKAPPNPQKVKILRSTRVGGKLAPVDAELTVSGSAARYLIATKKAQLVKSTGKKEKSEK